MRRWIRGRAPATTATCATSAGSWRRAMADQLEREDLEARVRALDERRSILLQAPAGSGKTSVLTQRFLRLLATVDDPGAILAVTFTRKAAAEMRARVIRALRGEVRADEPCAPELGGLAEAARQHARSRGRSLEEDAQALRIQTIDSFTYWLASQLPIAARAGGALEVTETPDELYRRAARRTLLTAEHDAALGADAALLFERLDNQWILVERLLAEMLEKRAHWLRYVLGSDPGELCARVNASLSHMVRGELARILARLPPALRLAAQELPGIGALREDPAHLGAWKRLAARTLTGGHWRQRLTARGLGAACEEGAARTALRSCIEGLRRVDGLAELLVSGARLPAALDASDQAAIAALSRVLARSALELHAEFADSGLVDYTYVTGAARAALAEAGQPTELALRTGLSLQHILVDEFQDTSLAQFQLLESLTAAWEEGDGRTLFIVGDPMQSIYRFRDAEVGLFITAREHGIGNVRLTPLRLTRNFRATPALVDWTNQVFAQVFPAADELRAPWCGASLATLTALSAAEEPQLLWESLAEPGRLAHCAPRDLARLARVREVLGGALEQRDGGPAADWLEATWVRLGAPDAYPRAELADARVFFAALAERAAAFEWRGPEDFPALLQDLYSAPDAPGVNPVQVM